MRKLLGVLAVATIAIAVAACSGKSSGGASNKVGGTIGGNTFTPRSGSFSLINLGPTSTLDLGILSDDPNFCANAGTGSVKANGKIMLVEFGQVVGGSNGQPAQTTGDYTVVSLQSTAAIPNMVFTGFFSLLDNSCDTPTASQVNFQSGTMNLSKITTAEIDGKSAPTISMGTAGTITLSMALKSCPALTTLFLNSSINCTQ